MWWDKGALNFIISYLSTHVHSENAGAFLGGDPRAMELVLTPAGSGQSLLPEDWRSLWALRLAPGWAVGCSCLEGVCDGRMKATTGVHWLKAWRRDLWRCSVPPVLTATQCRIISGFELKQKHFFHNRNITWTPAAHSSAVPRRCWWKRSAASAFKILC